MTDITPQSVETTIETGLAVAEGVAILLPPNVQKLLAAAAVAMQAYQQWQAGGQAEDYTDAQTQAIFDQFAVNEAADQAAQAVAP